MRVELKHKLALGFLCVAGVSLALPPLLSSLGVPAWGAFFAALGVSVAVASVVAPRITRNVVALRRCTDRIRHGDLTASVELASGRRYPDETVDLARSVRGMLEDLCSLVALIQSASEEVSQSARDLEGSTQELDAAHRAIASTVESVALGAERQRQVVDGTSARIREVADAIRASAGAARETFDLTAEARQRATSGGDVSRLGIAEMQKLFERVEGVGQRAFRLEEKIRSVHRITEMITSVAEKTHLLSLNASIEAARAGEAGRGFSVVAEEIRKLAESATGSADQIAELVRQLETESEGIAGSMRSIGEGIRRGREDLDTISGSLEQIQAAVDSAARRSEEIVQQADRQAGEIEATVSEVDAIRDVTGENVRATEAVRRELAQQIESMERTVGQAARLSQTAARLDQVARRFRTRS